MKLLVVESPAKSKTISKYLGSDFVVVPSVGHVRDLDPHDGAVDVDNGFQMKWAIMKDKEQRIRDIEKYMKKADAVYLATDPDREGEAISWHIIDILKSRNELTKPIHRVAFHEITKSAVTKAIQEPRDIDDKLVNAYLARRALDFLVGFKLSPVLWRKLPGCKSAGRVQSVALRLVCERESEIENFVKREYWSIDGKFATNDGKEFPAKLFSYNGNKLDKFDIPTKEKAEEVLSSLANEQYHIGNIERKKQARKPVAPFTTSTLQQEASRKLGFSAKQTMQIAQKLYEGIDLGGETVGLITYMRTDAVNLSAEAVASIREMIKSDFGDEYLPKSPVSYDNKSKNAQEAHEAIRPTYATKTPQSIKGYLDANQFKLYELIWKRTVACQMVPAELNLVSADIVTSDNKSIFRANGSMIAFDGFMRLYKEDIDDASSDDDDNRMLPTMNEGDNVKSEEIKPEQHFTQPPPRYSEASLVKKMEELGIGRPSTYASILSVIQERHYVDLVKKKFVPQERGRIVSVFLEKYFTKYVEYDFTAYMEDELDEISNGKKNYKDVLAEFWTGFKNAVESSNGLSMNEITDAIDNELGSHFFPATTDGSDPRKCPDCENGRLGIKLGKFGGFIGCSNYPTCKYTKPLILNDDEEDGASPAPKTQDGQVLGQNENGENIYLKNGPYGNYLQLGDAVKGDVRGPLRAPIPKNIQIDALTLEKAIFLLSLPKSIGFDGEDEVFVAIGKFGPYVKKGNVSKSIPASTSIFDVDIKIAHDLLLGAVEKPKGKELGTHPDDGKPVVYFKTGKFGPYVQHNRVFASIPASVATEETITLELAIEKLAPKEPKKKPEVKEKPKPKK